MKHRFLNPGNTFQRLLEEYQKYGSIVVAVDFDNTLYDYHHNGLDCTEVIQLVQNLKKIGCTITLWTASDDIEFIHQYCSERSIPFDLLNENPAFFQSNSRKIYYNELLDDRSGLHESYHRLSRLYEFVTQNTTATVFLGGTCNGSLWRDTLIPMLKMDYFNPVTDNWMLECQEEEIRQRATSDFCLYTITPKMTGVFSIAEVVEDSIKQPHKTILCLLDQDGKEEFTTDQWNSLTAVAELVNKNGAQVCYSLAVAANLLCTPHPSYLTPHS